MYVSANQWVREIIREGDVATCCRHQHILVFGILEPRNCYAQRGATSPEPWATKRRPSLSPTSTGSFIKPPFLFLLRTLSVPELVPCKTKKMDFRRRFFPTSSPHANFDRCGSPRSASSIRPVCIRGGVMRTSHVLLYTNLHTA